MAYKSIILPDVKDYLDNVSDKHRIKIEDFIRLLEDNDGYLDEPYSRHLKGKIRELRASFGKTAHRILYTLISEKRILHLIAFKKTTPRTPPQIIKKAEMIREAYIKIEKKNRK